MTASDIWDPSNIGIAILITPSQAGLWGDVPLSFGITCSDPLKTNSEGVFVATAAQEEWMLAVEMKPWDRREGDN